MPLYMTFEEAYSILNQNGFIIKDIKDIQNGKRINLSNGGIVVCYGTGKCVIQGQNQEMISAIFQNQDSKCSRKVFVVYGHDENARTQLEALLRRWDLEPIILDRLASGGSTIIEKLEYYSHDVAYAIVLATPDDVGGKRGSEEYKPRVRQNVVLELGMLLAKLGRKRVAILQKEWEGFEKPSDIDGLVYIPFQSSVEEAALSLVRELARQGISVDQARL